MDHHQTLAQLQATLNDLRQHPGQLPAFCRHCRAQDQLLAALPPRYGEVLHQLLDRLESSALFAEESCSFSQHDLLANLQLWLDKARQQLTP